MATMESLLSDLSDGKLCSLEFGRQSTSAAVMSSASVVRRSRYRHGHTRRPVAEPLPKFDTAVTSSPSPRSLKVSGSTSPRIRGRHGPCAPLLRNLPVFEVLCSGLTQNVSIIRLDLGHTRLEAAHAAVLGKVLMHNKTIEELSLYHNKIGAEGAWSVCKALEHNTTLRVLDLSVNSVFNEGAKAIANMLLKNSTLTQLDLSRCDIFVEGASAIFHALKVNRTLSSLSIVRNGVWTMGATVLGEMLALNTCLRYLDISHSFLYDDGAIAIAKGLAQNSGLTELHLGVNEIGDAGIKSICSALKNNALSTLTTLMLHENLIRAEGAKAIAKCLQSKKVSSAEVKDPDFPPYSNLTALHVCDNQIDESGAEMLGSMLKHNSSLTSLHLANNAIRGKGTKGLVRGLTSKRNTTLTELNIGGNVIGIEGATCIAAILVHGSPLKTLHLNRNKLDSAAASVLAEAIIAPACSLRAIDLSSNRIDLHGLEQLSTAMIENHQLTWVDLADQKGQPADLDVDLVVAPVLRRNRAIDAIESRAAFLLGLLPRLSEHSSLRAFADRRLGDKNVIHCIWKFLHHSDLPIKELLRSSTTED
jgi:Ran GTPase-activating protein (RanGAP) involved in mRNA processing and transport